MQWQLGFYKFVHTNFVFVRKTSNLFVRIREGFQHVMLRTACTIIEDAPFFSLILNTSVKHFCPTLGASLIGDFSSNHNKKLKFIVPFKVFLNAVPWYDRTLEQTSFWVITNRFGPAQQDKIGLGTSSNLHTLSYSLT